MDGTGAPRVAFFADSFHEMNGVALTSRMLEAHARERALPLVSVHTGPATEAWDEGSVRRVELGLGPASLRLESDLRFDVFFARHRARLLNELRLFSPNVLHVTGPSHLGILGVWAAHTLGIPLVASWHTNVHEYAGRRLSQNLSWLSMRMARRAGDWAERATLRSTLLFYKLARRTLAPNPELTAMLERATGRPSALMKRGVDTERYAPRWRTREDAKLRIGFAGRLSPEKGVRWLADVGERLKRDGAGAFEIWIAGQGAEAEWLRANVPHTVLTGALRGDALARFYANLDLFAFPSETDTYGNVIQEAMASGVPCVVTAGGGPKFLVQHERDGEVAQSREDFALRCAALVRDTERRIRMGLEARRSAEQASWARVMDDVWSVYAACTAAL